VGIHLREAAFFYSGSAPDIVSDPVVGKAPQRLARETLEKVVRAVAIRFVVGRLAAAEIERARPVRHEAHRLERRALV
jgi:hypothetical protein